ncbi:hypothetical protein ANO11243_096520 [Dothideomycetidae sp. 11243]|nr:hypothetical protein ANO11243_096520 [fungal sp. No.11243]
MSSDKSEHSHEQSSPEYLQKQAKWIRDELELMIASDGPDSLKPDQVVKVFKSLETLRRARIPVEHLRSSRIHLAVSCISSSASRWPNSVVQEADKLLEMWTAKHGTLNDIGLLLYEEGGRLHGVCGPNDLSKEVLEVKWAKAPGSKTLGGFARHYGDLGFKPGESVDGP